MTNEEIHDFYQQCKAEIISKLSALGKKSYLLEPENEYSIDSDLGDNVLCSIEGIGLKNGQIVLFCAEYLSDCETEDKEWVENPFISDYLYPELLCMVNHFLEYGTPGTRAEKTKQFNKYWDNDEDEEDVEDED